MKKEIPNQNDLICVSDRWNLIEVLCLFMSCIQTVLTFTYVGLCGQDCVQAKVFTPATLLQGHDV